MHGHHGFGHIGRGLGRGFGRGFGGGWGLGWIFPAWIIGQAISQAFDQPAEPAPSNWPPLPAAPFPAQTAAATQPAAAVSRVTCQGCGTQVTGTLAFCPVCGERLSPAACRYCGQKLQTENGLCVHCGAPRR